MSSNKITRSDFPRICRVCLEDRTLNSMFPVEKPEICQMFMACTSIDVNCTNKLPNQICFVCLSRMTECYNFKQLCESSNQILLDVLNNDTSKTEFNDEVQSKVEKGAEVRKSKINNCKSENHCNVVNNKFEYKTDNSKIEDDTSNESIFPQTKIKQTKLLSNPKYKSSTECKLCNQVLSCPSALAQHLRKNHQKKRRYNCDKCTKSFYELSEFGAHMKRAHNEKPLNCKKCGKKFMVQKQLGNHMKRAHGIDNQFVCKDCGKSFHQLNLLEKHRVKHIKERLFHCIQCDKSFKGKAALQRHLQRHSDKKKLEICNICGKAVVYLASHVYIHNNDGDYKKKCDICLKKISPQYLSSHKKRKHPNPDEPRVKPYLCSMCGFATDKKGTLEGHIQFKHTTERAFKCPLCDKSFKMNYIMKKHIRVTHNKEGRVKCTVCMKDYQTNCDLRIHMRTHTGERPYKCEMCGKAFSQGSTLKTHMKIHGTQGDENKVDEVMTEKSTTLKKKK